ncbi:KilA-N domain-containing protein [Tateyamaria sp.]|uniref:KilA-N domain-containing protein n=1 Tax=Tateyamaria sp. TaxID=1929288 RepID=UPI00329C0CFD
MSNIGPVSNGKLEKIKVTTDTIQDEFFLRSIKIRVDEGGFVSLNDIHKAAGFSKNKRPAQWQRLPSTNSLIIATYERVVGKSHKGKVRTSEVYKATAEGSWANPILAASYAGCLKPELEVEMREVWLRYKSADPTLADEVLQRATDEQNEWAATRALSRAKRNQFTDTLKAHDVTKYGYGNCTNAVYKEVLGGTKKQVIESRNLPAGVNLRDAIPKNELVYVMMAETLASERIQDENPTGNGPCAKATSKSAAFVRRANEGDRKDRQKGMDV